MTRPEVTIELKKRGYVKADYPGTWLTPEGDLVAWFIAAKKENLTFDRNSWGPEIIKVKENWRNRKLKKNGNSIKR